MKYENKKKIFDRYNIVLLLLLTVLILVNFNWIRNDERPTTDEDTDIFDSSVRLYLENTKLSGLCKGILDLDYPPFIPSLIYLSFKIFGPSYDSALYVNLLFWPVLVLSCFFLGKKLYNEKTGLLAAFILSTLPPIIIFSRSLYDEFILISLVVLNLTLFAYSDYFKNRKFSLLYGLSFALCLLTRYTSLPYIIVPPLFFIFFKSNIIKKLRSAKQLFYLKLKQNTIINITKIIIEEKGVTIFTNCTLKPGQSASLYCTYNWVEHAGQNLTLTIYTNATSQPFSFIFPIPAAELNITNVKRVLINGNAYLNITIQNMNYSIWNLTISKVVVTFENQTKIFEQNFAKNLPGKIAPIGNRKSYCFISLIED
mgnify:CR=1 FL=1